MNRSTTDPVAARYFLSILPDEEAVVMFDTMIAAIIYGNSFVHYDNRKITRQDAAEVIIVDGGPLLWVPSDEIETIVAMKASSQTHGSLSFRCDRRDDSYVRPLYLGT